VRPLNPVLQVMVRSRHGRKGVKHGETGARRRQGTILAASPGTLVFKRTFGAVGPSKKRGSPALSVMLDCSSPVWLVDVLGNEARQIGQAARLIRSAGEPEFPIGIIPRCSAQPRLSGEECWKARSSNSTMFQPRQWDRIIDRNA